MPRSIDKDLRDCLERANPYTEYRIELSQPDTSQVLRRPDQFTQAPSLVSMTPANSLAASARGSLILAPSVGVLQAFAGVQASYDLNGESEQRRYKGVAWTMDKSFSQVTLKSIQAKIQRVSTAGFYFDADIECQIFRITKIPGFKQKNVGTPQYQSVIWNEYTFSKLLTPAPVLKASAQIWDSSQRTTLTFDLSNWNLTLFNSPARAVAPDQVGELPEYLIVVRLAGKPPAGTGHFKWLLDTASARTIAGIGTFERVWWARDNDGDQWARNAFTDVPNITLSGDVYPATGQGVFLVDQGAVPGALSAGRADFQRVLPPGTAATLEISTAGAGGPWTPIKHGDDILTKQQTYHLRATLNADAALRATPQITSMGVEFRIARDVSVEGIPDLPTREIDLPWPRASIPEGRVRVVRTGVRDYLDVASVLGSTAPASRLGADIFLASRHPSVTRDKWLRLERMLVTNRVPTATSEEFTLVSYASRLKRKIPQKAETINSVHVVKVGTTRTQIIIDTAAPGSGPLPNTTTAGSEYDGKGYYVRVRSTAAPNTPVGFLATIAGNAGESGHGTDRLDFDPGAFAEALVAGDVIEVHSGIFQTEQVAWVDIDPADAWDRLMALVPVPVERIGLGYLPRGGKPPRVTDIAPNDPVTQRKLLITINLKEEEPADELIDQISTILGGVTLEIDGQLVFVQIFPLVDINGAVTVPLPPPAAIFDSRDISSIATPPGLEKRATIVSCVYGVPATAVDPDAFPPKSTTSVDQDALLWLAQQDLEEYGTADVPDKITRWLYNSADGGLYLAAVMGTRLAKTASTGLRVFPIGMAEKQPELVPGDVVIIATDQYTDYDPSSQVSIVGPVAIRGIVVRSGREGRDLALFVPGLRENVQLVKAGSGGILPGLGRGDDLFSLIDFRVIKELVPSEMYPNGARVYGWTNGELVAEVWAGYLTYTLPIPDDPWALVVARLEPLDAGATSITVPKPPEGSRLYLQVEPRTEFLEAGEYHRAEIEAEPNQAPLLQLDDKEDPSGTFATQWIRYVERGIRVIGALLRNQIGSNPIGPLNAPTRQAGDVSLVRGGVLGTNEIEQDIALDADRLSFIDGELELENGESFPLGPFTFDRDKKPNILSVSVVGTLITVLGDSGDTKSIRISDANGTWEYVADGRSVINVDVSKPGTNGVAGLGAATKTYRIELRSDPSAYVTAATLITSTERVISGTGAPPVAAQWDQPGVQVAAPVAANSDVATITLKATAAPAGSTVKLYIGVSTGVPDPVDHTADVAPALSTPPTVNTTYSYSTDFPKAAVRTDSSQLVNMTVRADLVDSLGNVLDTRTVTASWYIVGGQALL